MSSDAQPIEEARQQAIEYLGFLAPKKVLVKDEEFVIPSASLLDKDQTQRYNELQFSLEALDRWPDTKNADGEVIRMGDPKMPHRKKGKLEEDYDIKLLKALLGDEAAERYLAKGGLPGDVALFWAESNQRVVERRAADSKSLGRDQSLAAVPDAD